MTHHLSGCGRIAGLVVATMVLFGGTATEHIAPAAEPPDVVNVEVRNLTRQTLKSVPVTFGQVFRKGDVPRGKQVHCPIDDCWAQVDPKRGYDDGSLRFAVVSVVLPELPAGGAKTLRMVAAVARPGAELPPVMLSDLLKTDFDAVVSLKSPDGAVRTASARKLLARTADATATWLRGQMATEWLVSGPPVDKEGNPDEDLSVQFQVRAYRGCRRVRVSVAVENCWDHWAGNIRYDVTVTLAGKPVFSQQAVDHRRLSRWRKVFWTGEGEPNVHLVHDLAYMSATGALPNYDRTLPPVEPDWERKEQLTMEGPRWQIMGRGAVCAYMPTTGGRPEIAPYPTWTVRYLLDMTPRAKAVVLAGGDLAGSWPIHVRARKTGRIMTIDERPKFWLDQRGEDRPEWKPDRHPPGPNHVKLSPDLAHQGSFAYVPYLVTGDYYYLEEAYFWANYCLLSTWQHPRQDARGILSGQIRGNAWSLRNIADAAWIAPDGHPEGKYFDQKIRNNIADRIRRMYGPPEYNKLGFWGIRSTKDARIQNPANPRWMIIAPWEHDYLMWSLHHLVELGHAEAAKPRDFLLRWRVGALTNAPDFDPLLATPYRMAVGEQTDREQVAFYEGWKKLGLENASLSKPGLPNYGCSYAYSARAAAVCGIDGGFPKSEQAVKWLEDNLPDHRQVMARNPAWAILPGGAAAGRR